MDNLLTELLYYKALSAVSHYFNLYYVHTYIILNML